MLADFVKETTATTGTAATLSLSAVAGFARFADAFAVGSPVVYAIQSGNNRETGLGTVGAGNTLTRVRATAKYESGVLTKTPATFLSLAGTSEVMISLSAAATDVSQSAVLRAKTSVAKHVYSADGWYTIRSNLTISANYLYVWPYKLDVSGDVTKIGCIANATKAGATCRLGLYRQTANGGIGNLLFDSGLLTPDTANTLYLASVTQTHLQAGWYWAVAAGGATGPDLMAMDRGNAYIGTSGSDGGRFVIGLNYASFTLGPLPSDGTSFPALTAEVLANIPKFPAITLEML